ncbi:ABC transporter substrate-binding protein [Neomegalonema sp.]|uniref:ABC transporter substrate-binding protein n=1 Tax=Neomegalonema sp. TaxID=2039713 RepID=UPI00261A95A6|nr:ABC transporter substrate-binding protein [Neomegalonema sp.]MDD2868690.1 ABC transporter substrate-binding protein [Neomegalonema sp.]
MTYWRRAAGAFALALLTAFPAAAEVRTEDLTGREVVLAEPARRIVLGEGRHLAVLGLTHEDPASLVAGWRLSKPLDEGTLEAWRAKFPEIDAIRDVGGAGRDLSVEAILAADPDLVVLPLADSGAPGLLRARERLEKAGVPLAYVDFFTHPESNTIPSLRILGTLTGSEAKTEEFIDFYEGKLKAVRAALDDPELQRPSVFFHVHAGGERCCSTAGGGVFNDFIEMAGGENLGADLVKGVVGDASLESVLLADPDFYVATGGAHMAARGGLVLGPGVSEETARAGLDKLLASRGIAQLTAVEQGRALGVWHLFNDSPLHVVLIELLAKTFHPDRTADLDPAATLAEIEARFSPVPTPGIYWLKP